MKIQKRNGLYQEYDKNKIKLAIQKAFNSLDQIIGKTDLDKIIEEVEKDLADQINVEMIQDKVEEALMKQGYLQVAKAYILYRQKHSEQRDIINELIALIKDEGLIEIFNTIQKDYPDKEYSLQLLLAKFKSFYKEEMSFQEALTMLIKAANELTSKEAPKWEMISTRFFKL